MKRFLLVIVLIGLGFKANADGLRTLNDNSLGLTRKLLAFEHDGLSQYALVIEGDIKGLQSENIVVVAHGYHPDPINYGRTANGQSLRPGDYYRDWINAYASAGFNVLVPDYRGHNASEGFEYTHKGLSEKTTGTEGTSSNPPEHYYTRDLLAALNALQQKTQKQFAKVVLVGHSMGAPIAFHAAQQLPEQAMLVSLWSSAEFRFESNTLAPNFVIHHGQNDIVTPIKNTAFYIDNYTNNLIGAHIYKSADHMLSGKDFRQAMETDTMLIREAFNAD